MSSAPTSHWVLSGRPGAGGPPGGGTWRSSGLPR